MLESRHKFSLLARMVCLLGTFSALAPSARADNYWLSDLVLRDAYQLDIGEQKEDDPEAKKAREKAGVIVFAYREIALCPNTLDCRRLALMWVPPSGPIVEIPVEEKWLVAATQGSGGQGFKSREHLISKVPPELTSTAGYHVDFKIQGERGEILLMNDTRFVRMFGRDPNKRLMSTETLERRMRARFPGYLPSTPPMPSSLYTVLEARDKPNLFLVLSRPRANDATHVGWKVGLFELLPDGELGIVATSEGHDYARRTAGAPFHYTDRLKALVGANYLNDPELCVFPNLSLLTLDNKTRTYLTGVTDGDTSQVVSVARSANVETEIRGLNPATGQVSLTHKFAPLRDKHLAIRLVTQFGRERARYLAIERPEKSPFFEMIAAAKCGTSLQAKGE